MKKLCLTLAVCLTLWSPVAMAQGMMGMDMDSEKGAANLNRDGYPYTVLANRPLLPPKEKRKVRDYQIKYEQYQRAREISYGRQFRAMSADERRWAIQHQGYPSVLRPGYK